MAVTLLGIKNPLIIQEGLGAIAVMKDPVPESYLSSTAQTWLKNSFVYTSGTGASVVLNGLATNGTVIYGQAPHAAFGGPAATVGAVPPASLFGNGGPDTTPLHYPFDVKERIIEINIANNSASGATIGTTSGVAWDGSGTNGVALAPGQQYGVIVPTSGAYAKMTFLDVTNTTNKLFEIVRLAPNELTDANSGRIQVKVIPTIIQG